MEILSPHPPLSPLLGERETITRGRTESENSPGPALRARYEKIFDPAK